MLLEGLGRLKNKVSGLIGNIPRDLPACCIVPQPTTLPRVPRISRGHYIVHFTQTREVLRLLIFQTSNPVTMGM
jgi:hypothetical protein